MLRSLRTSFASLAVLAACASAHAEPPHARAQAASAAGSLAALARGTRTVLVSDIPTAENVLFLSDGRLLVSGDKGLYHLTRDASGKISAQNLVPNAPCAFGGIAEARATVYVTCYDFSRAYIYASSLEPLAFERAVEVKDTIIGNGMSTDGERLYLSSTGQMKIVQLSIDPSDPKKLGGQTNFISGLDTPLPNGIDILDGALYWTDLLTLKTVPLDKKKPARTLATRATLYDDLHVDARGVIACDYTGNVLVAYDPTGKQVAQTKPVFKSPSAVVPARGRLGFGQDDLIVTERGGGIVSVYRPE
ncbi:MAG: hypothetical protein ABW252_06200 [Polyangiales bacterium]